MKQNKGFIGISLILAIILGIFAAGGAYYLEKNNFKKEVNNLENILPNNESQNIKQIDNNQSPVVDNNQQVTVANTTSSSSITVLSPNGGEVYKDTDKIAIKWKSTGKDRIAIYLRFSSGEWCEIKDVPSTDADYIFTPFGHNCGDGRGSISGIQKYKITLIAYQNGGMAPEPGTAFAGDYSDNYGSDTGYSIDSSDNSFTINSVEVKKNDPYNRYISADCKISVGCNGPINCVDKNFDDNISITTCEYLPEYACYKINTIKCEKQISGKCGWTNSPELKSCIDTARSSGIY